MAEIVEFPVEAGGVLRVQAVDGLDGGGQGLVPAAPNVGDVVERARQTLESAIGTVTPALETITRQLRKLSPDEVAVAFGFVLSAEHGVIIAKAGGEIHFNVTMTWKSAGDQPGTDAAGLGDAAVPAALDSADAPDAPGDSDGSGAQGADGGPGDDG